MIMNRSRCKNTYFKNKTVENWEKYRKLRNECVKLTKKVKRDYFQKLDIKQINDNKRFWKTVKPFLSGKGNIEHKKIILVENDEIIRDEKKNADIMNNYFVNVTKILDVPEIMTEQISMNIDIVDVDPIDAIFHKLYNHPSILKIRENVKLTETFTFSKINETQIIKEILESLQKLSNILLQYCLFHSQMYSIHQL